MTTVCVRGQTSTVMNPCVCLCRALCGGADLLEHEGRTDTNNCTSSGDGILTSHLPIERLDHVLYGTQSEIRT